MKNMMVSLKEALDSFIGTLGFLRKVGKKTKLGSVLWSAPKWDTLGADPRLSDSLLHPRPKTEPVHSWPALKACLAFQGPLWGLFILLNPWRRLLWYFYL